MTRKITVVSLVAGVCIFTLLWQIEFLNVPLHLAESPISFEDTEQADVAVLFLSPDASSLTLWTSEIKSLAESSKCNIASIAHVTDASSLQSLFIAAVEGGAEYVLLVAKEPPTCPGVLVRMVNSLRSRGGSGVASTALGSARMVHKSHAQVFASIVPPSLSHEASWQWLRLVYGGNSSSIECKSELDRHVSLEETELPALAKELSTGCIELSLYQKAQGREDWDRFQCGELKGSPTDPVPAQLKGDTFALADPGKAKGEWSKFKEVLAAKADKDKVVLVAFTNDGFLSMTLNWVYYVQKLGLEYLLISLDETVYKELQDYNIPTFYEPSMRGNTGEEQWASSGYVTITVLKIRYALLITSLGYHTFLCDTDIVILQVRGKGAFHSCFLTLEAFRTLFGT
jgi:hypothetical protein